jgi:hypothetical protein
MDGKMVRIAYSERGYYDTVKIQLFYNGEKNKYIYIAKNVVYFHVCLLD